MNIRDFILHFEEVFDGTDINSLNPETNFRELDEWSSVSALSTMAMVSDVYEVELSADEMRSTTTFQQLFDLVSSKL